MMEEWTNSRYGTLPVTRNEQSFPVAMAVSSLPLEELLTTSSRFLHPDEHTTLTGTAQHHYLLGRHAAKLAAFHLTQIWPAKICISAGVFGQPVLYCPGHSNIQVSIAHTGGSAIAVVFPEAHPMAVDMEDIRSGHLSPPLTPAEVTLAASLPHGPMLLWTAREALSKVLKTGLTTDMELFAVQSVIKEGDFRVFTFANFIQYKAISWIAGNMVCSLVLPQRSQADLAVLKTLTYPAS